MVASGAVCALVLMAAFGLIIQLSASMHRDLSAATDGFIQEQEIADRLVRAVSRQLVAASFFGRYQNEAVMTDFRNAGDDAYSQIRRYLSRPLTASQRLQLELVKEQHERLDVSASEAFDLFRNGDVTNARDPADNMIAHSMELQRALDKFLVMRERDLVVLRERQASIFGYLYVGAGALALLLLGGFMVLAHFLSRRITSPLAQLMAATTRVASGDLQARVTSMHDDEFATVASSFNRMGERLASVNIDLQDRNTELEMALDSLQNLHRELVQTEKLSAMGRMMAGLAHELNNPLTSVLGYAELLDDQLGQPAEPGGIDRAELRRELLHPLLEQAVRARGLVRDFLQFSRDESVGVVNVRLHDALDVIVRLRAYAFKQSGLGIHLDEDAEAYVYAQPQRLEQVFLNLTNNAFDAMQPQGHGTLRISAHTEQAFVIVKCEDDGPGFAAHDRAFEPFYTTKPIGSGTGLGLSLVHQFMEEFGGSVRAENRAEGGARIVLMFRMAEATIEPVPEPEVSSPAATTARALRILVVEDEAPLRMLQKRILGRLDAEVLLAANVHEAQRIVESNILDLVISDVRLPGGLSGVDFYRWIEATHPTLADRFLFITGDVTDTEIAEIAEQRPDRVIHKPFMMQDYLERVSQLVGGPEVAAVSS